VTVLPNSVPLPALPDPALQEPGRILFLGRLETAKGIDELLDAAAALAPRFPQLRLVLGGEGDLAHARRRAAELGIADRVELPGWIGPAARDAELARAAVFCLPSHAEGLPMSMLEAMAAGRPVVVTSVGGIPETIQDRDNGLLVPPRDAAALAAALASVLEDDALRAHLAARARETIEQQYSLAVVGEQLASLYRELVGAK
jgi:glycosyltransferase involved in cell wall biosynthesis